MEKQIQNQMGDGQPSNKGILAWMLFEGDDFESVEEEIVDMICQGKKRVTRDEVEDFVRKHINMEVEK